MDSLKRRTFRFQPALSIFALALIGLFITLGNWQLNRADEKQQLHLQRIQRAHLPPATALPEWIADESSDELAEKPVRVQGEFENQWQVLLENQIRTRQIGMYVLTPFRITETGQRVMVNRGWLAAEPGSLPDQPLQANATEISGWLRSFPGTGYHVEQIPARKIEGMEILISPGVRQEDLEKFIGYPVYPMVIFLNENSDGGFDRDWPAIPGSADRHRAYAAQWFLFAFLAVVFYGLLSFRKT